MQEFIVQFSNMKVIRFHLKKGDSVPLHIHNGQNGFAYLLEGKCKAQCYSAKELDDNKFELTPTITKEVKPHSYCVATPEQNAHTITALEDCTFLDCFSLAQNDSCCCIYVETLENHDGKLTVKTIPLEEAGMPEYWYARHVEVQEVS